MILEPTITLENNLFLIKNDSSTICFILLGKNYLSYVVADSESSKIYSLKHYYMADKVIGKNDFIEILNDDNLAKATEVHIAIDSLKSSLIPESFFDKDLCNQFLNFSHEIDKEEIIEHQIVNEELVDLFALKKSTISFLSSKLKNVTYYNATACLLQTYPSHIINEHHHSLFLSIKDESICMTFYKKNLLQLHQIIEISDVHDILYHVANLITNLNIQEEILGIQIHGETELVDKAIQTLKPYYNYVRYCTRIKELQYPDTLYSKPAHYFFNLFSLVSCVL